MIPFSAIAAVIIGIVLRKMMRSENENMSRIGGVLMLVLFIFGGVVLFMGCNGMIEMNNANEYNP